MKFTVSRETLLRALQGVVGVVERKQTLPILSNVLIRVGADGQLSITGTDLEVEIIGHASVETVEQPGDITVPGRKLLDIARSLPEDAGVNFAIKDNTKAVVSSGRSRFTLTTLPANEFPNVDEGEGKASFTIEQKQLKQLLDQTSFAMAQQDVRYYLNGMLIEAQQSNLRAVATDGHRLAMCTKPVAISVPEPIQVILPRKGVMELSRLLSSDDESADVVIGANHIRITTGDCCFTSKLVDGNYPDYDRVLPRGGNNVVTADRELLKQACGRASILSNEKYRGVRVLLSNGAIKLVANNPEQEEAEEEVTVDYSGDSFEMGFNVGYLMDVMNILPSEQVRLTLSDANSSALVENPSDSEAVYVVMPMRL